MAVRTGALLFSSELKTAPAQAIMMDPLEQASTQINKPHPRHHTIITHPLLISDRSEIQPYDLPHVGSCTSCSDYDGVPSPTLKETYFEPSWQEYPGTIVNPSYHTLTCVRCGTNQTGDGAGHFIDGVDFKGQSMYAGMTTHEVAMMCTCHDDPHDCYPCNSEYY